LYIHPRPPHSPPLPYTTLFRSEAEAVIVRPATTARIVAKATAAIIPSSTVPPSSYAKSGAAEFWPPGAFAMVSGPTRTAAPKPRSEEHTSELQSRFDLVCRLLL